MPECPPSILNDSSWTATPSRLWSPRVRRDGSTIGVIEMEITASLAASVSIVQYFGNLLQQADGLLVHLLSRPQTTDFLSPLSLPYDYDWPIRATARMIEIFHRGKRIAAHQRRYGGPRFGTDPDHMPSSHRRYAEWTPDRFRRWGASIGPETEGLVTAILASRPHPEQGF